MGCRRLLCGLSPDIDRIQRPTFGHLLQSGRRVVRLGRIPSPACASCTVREGLRGAGHRRLGARRCLRCLAAGRLGRTVVDGAALGSGALWRRHGRRGGPDRPRRCLNDARRARSSRLRCLLRRDRRRRRRQRGDRHRFRSCAAVHRRRLDRAHVDRRSLRSATCASRTT